MADVSLAQLLEAGVHFGHKAYRWNPKMFPYIYTERNNIHILDLVQSAQLLKEASNYVHFIPISDNILRASLTSSSAGIVIISSSIIS